MADMVQFSQVILQSVITFLGTPPVFYLFCLICFVPIIKMVRTLLKMN